MSYIQKEPFSLYSIYYDLIYADKNYSAESDYIANLLRGEDPSIKSLVELGSGTGNYAAFLCKKGFSVTGVEKSNSMLLQSERKLIDGFSVQAADMVTFDLNKQFDAVISLFHVMSYLTKTEDVISCFKKVAAHLKQNGVFVFDVWYTPAVNHIKPESRIKVVENGIYKVVRHAEPVVHAVTNTIEVRYEIIITEKTTDKYYQLQEIHNMRHFSTPEIAQFGEIVGLELIKSEEFLTAKAPSAETWGVCYMLRKK